MSTAAFGADWCSPKGSSTSWHLPIGADECLAPVGTSWHQSTTPAPVTLSGPLESVPFWRWPIHFTGREVVEVRFSLAATHDEAMSYPSALAAEPMPERSKRPATAAEERELRALINQILAQDSAADRAEGLQVALADPDAAMVCFRGLRPC